MNFGYIFEHFNAVLLEKILCTTNLHAFHKNKYSGRNNHTK